MADFAMAVAVLNEWRNPGVAALMSVRVVDWSWIGMSMPRDSSKNGHSTSWHATLSLYRWADGNSLTPCEGNAWGLATSTLIW